MKPINATKRVPIVRLNYSESGKKKKEELSSDLQLFCSIDDEFKLVKFVPSVFVAHNMSGFENLQLED